MKYAVGCCVFAVIAFPIYAQPSVHIVDHPGRVLPYSPIPVTVRVHNEGHAPLLLPSSNQTDSRYFVLLGTTAGTKSEYRPEVDRGGGAVVWLEPGHSWLFQVDIGRFWNHEPGLLRVSAGIRSTGACQYDSTGMETFPLQLARDGFVEWYECWSGYVESDAVSVEIVEPAAALDREAIGYYRAHGLLGSLPHAGVWSGFAELRERFPMSDFTFALGVRECEKAPDCLRELLELQPTHALAPYARFQWANALLRTERSKEVTDAFVDELVLPAGLKEFLIQRRREGVN